MIASTRSLSPLAIALVLVSSPIVARAQSDWDVVVAPYVLFGSLTGEAAIGPGTPTPVNLSFVDLVKNLRLGAMVHTVVVTSVDLA